MLFSRIIRYFAVIMRCPFYISLLFYCAVWMTACTGPVIVEEPEGKPSGAEQNDGTLIRDSVPIMHEGTYSSPYTIGEALTLGRGKSVWVEGYIVGCCETTTMKSGNNYKPMAMTKSNILLADTFLTGKEGDYLYCLAIKLPNNSIEREDLNLYDNPDNYHRKVRIHGDITLYLKGIGMENIYSYALANHETEDENDDDGEDEDVEELPNEDEGWDEPETPYDPDATNQDTLSIAEGIRLQSEISYNQVYIKGYIIGYTSSKGKIYYNLTDIKETSAKSNVILADNPEEKNSENMIAVELKNGSYIQEAVNLFDNPDNLYKQLTVKGRMYLYKSLNGCTEIPNGYIPPGDTVVIEDYYFLLE